MHRIRSERSTAPLLVALALATALAPLAACKRAKEAAPTTVAGPSRPQPAKMVAAQDGLAARPLVPVNGRRFGAMYFKHFGVNPTIDTAEENVSTFSVDVDTASYTLTRSYLSRGVLPPEEAIRVEEFVNALRYGYPPPAQAGRPFAVSAEAFPSPNRRGYHVLRLALRGRDVKAAQRKPANLVFVIDISGSMGMENRLGLVKRSLRLLVSQLEEKDKVGIVVYGSRARVVLEPTTAARKKRILAAIDSLRTGGSTNAQAGIRLGYRIAAEHLLPGGINRIVLCSDGVANNGVTSADGIFAEVKREAARGITVSTVGFGMGNYNDVLMERLAQIGNGNYAYVDRLAAARRIFVENLTGTLQVIAKDVKIQVVFDQKAVARYRLLGYENRQLRKRDFANDKIDAGEIGAGHTVTALYEVKLRPQAKARALGKLRLRYKAPTGTESRLVEIPLGRDLVRASLVQASGSSRLALVAAAFAEKLRGSYWVRNLSYDRILALWGDLPQAVRAQGDAKELRDLIGRARKLDKRRDRFARTTPVERMGFDHVPVLK